MNWQRNDGMTVFKGSADDGATWRDVSSMHTGRQSEFPNLAMHDNSIAPYFGPPGTVSPGNWSSGIAIDPFNPDHAMYTSCFGFWITSDLTKTDPNTRGVPIHRI